jgi:hypothetical protein
LIEYADVCYRPIFAYPLEGGEPEFFWSDIEDIANDEERVWT